MITSLQLIQEYCNRFNLSTPSVLRDDLYDTGDTYLHLVMDLPQTQFFENMANIDLKHCTKILRVQRLKLNVDVAIGSKSIVMGESIGMVQMEKNSALTVPRLKYISEYLGFVDNSFGRPLSTELMQNVSETRILGKVKQTAKKIYWSELTSKILPIVEELKEYGSNVELKANKFAIRDGQYVWNWITI